MTCDELAACWTARWPRPDEDTNALLLHRVKRFGADFRWRDIRGITREEARVWCQRWPGHHRWVKSMFNDAMSDGLLEENVFVGIRVPKEKRDLYIPSTAEVAALELAAPGQLAGAVTFAAYVGLRIGEIRGLRAGDFQGGHRLLIQRQARMNCSLEKPPKGGRSRYAVIPPPARDIEEWALGLDNPDQRVWPVAHRSYQRHWARTTRRCGIHVRFHDLRHHCASWLLDQGVRPEDVAIQLGHNDNGILVRRVYGHPDHEKALNRLEEALGVLG